MCVIINVHFLSIFGGKLFLNKIFFFLSFTRKKKYNLINVADFFFCVILIIGILGNIVSCIFLYLRDNFFLMYALKKKNIQNYQSLFFIRTVLFHNGILYFYFFLKQKIRVVAIRNLFFFFNKKILRKENLKKKKKVCI